MELRDLPNPPTGALHILPPWLLTAALIALGLALLAIWLWWKLRQRRRDPEEAIAVEVRPRTTSPDQFALLTHRIEDEFLRSKDYREGLHALAAAVRTRIRTRNGLDADTKTVTEIVHSIENTEVHHFLISLRDHQFGMQEPNKRLFSRLFRRARKIFGSTTTRPS